VGNGIILETSQRQAVDAVEKWFKTTSKRHERFVLAGLAGTGKTTIVKCIIEELKLEKDEVAFCAYTGKAAMVLTHKGTPATTMHKLMYDCEEDPETKEMKFFKKDMLDSCLKLIVVDEASMVGKEMQADLESYGIPVLYVGDHGQLPPVGEGYNNLMLSPSITLEKIHRQAEGNPIIFLAKLARLGAKIPYKAFGDKCIKLSASECTGTMLLASDQILCGKNETRKKLNLRIRALSGIQSPTVAQKDRIICLRNNWNKGYINGMTGQVISLYDFDTKACSEKDYWKYTGSKAMTFRDDMGEVYTNVPYDPAIFSGGQPDMRNRTIECFDYAYAITVHKSQGSQYLCPIVYEEYLGNADFHKKWLYTAVTRAADGLIIVGTGR